VEKVILKDESVDLKNKDLKFPKRLEIELMLFEEHLKNLVSTSQDRNALLILTTTPINLNAPPKKTCQFTNIEQAKSELKNLRDLLLANNPKQAYSESSKLIQKFLGNAELLFLHGQVAKRLGKKDEALTSLLKASAFDCNPWRATEVQNSIIRKVARENQVMLFDFAKMMEGYFDQEEAYFDELYPQNHYYEKAMEQLGMAIKDILKL
jgi:tetratricopeptide (TPR) repeat protein